MYPPRLQHWSKTSADSVQEYLHRPTAAAAWWPPPYSHVLGGHDLLREERGTWLGVTRQGRVAVLTNYREEKHDAAIEGTRSRGAIPNAFLKACVGSKETTRQFARRLVEENGANGVGGFSMLYGYLQDVARPGKNGLAIISNRTPDIDGLGWIAQHDNETHALSNTYFGDRTWPKVIDGEYALDAAIGESVELGETQDALIERLFDVLSVDRMPRQKPEEEWDTYLSQLRHSIFIPAIGKNSADTMPPPTGDMERSDTSLTTGVYATQKQTAILVTLSGETTFVERTRFDGNGRPVEKWQGDRRFTFSIEDW